jgi:hypothetical protein
VLLVLLLDRLEKERWERTSYRLEEKAGIDIEPEELKRKLGGKYLKPLEYGTWLLQ